MVTILCYIVSCHGNTIVFSVAVDVKADIIEAVKQGNFPFADSLFHLNYFTDTYFSYWMMVFVLLILFILLPVLYIHALINCFFNYVACWMDVLRFKTQYIASGQRCVRRRRAANLRGFGGRHIAAWHVLAARRRDAADVCGDDGPTGHRGAAGEQRLWRQQAGRGQRLDSPHAGHLPRVSIVYLLL